MYEQLKLENQICFPFYAASRLIIRAYQKDLDTLGITYPQLFGVDGIMGRRKFIGNWNWTKTYPQHQYHNPAVEENGTTRVDHTLTILERPTKNDDRIIGKRKTMQKEAAQIPYNLLKRLRIDQDEEKIEELKRLKYQIKELMELLKTEGQVQP